MIWIFSFSAFFLAVFLGLKIWEIKLERTSFLSKFLASKDNLFQRLHLVHPIFAYLGFKLKRKLKFFVFNTVPFYSSLFVTKVSAKVIGYFRKIKDNIRGKLEMKRGSLSASSYLKEIAKIKNRKSEAKKDTLNISPTESL